MIQLRVPLSISLGLALAVPAALALAAGDGWQGGDGAWRRDPAWYDGQAEKCVYEATRTIYGLERSYRAIAYTNKQHMDPETTVKAVAEGLQTLKHHWSERVPTENYDYDFSTAVFLADTDGLATFRLAVGTQEDCGASFKLATRAGARLDWLESVYHPGAGQRTGRIADAQDVVLEDALTLLLRDFPFADPRAIDLAVVPSQKSPVRASWEPFAATVRMVGTEELDLPVGRTRAHHLVLEAGDEERAHFWFAADGTAPVLHALVRYEGPGGVTYRLASLERTAYWER